MVHVPLKIFPVILNFNMIVRIFYKVLIYFYRYFQMGALTIRSYD